MQALKYLNHALSPIGPHGIFLSAQVRLLGAILLCALPVTTSLAQSGSNSPNVKQHTTTLNVIVHAPNDKVVTADTLDLYDSGVRQDILGFDRINTGSDIVLLVDNSVNLKVEGPALQKAALDVVNQLYQDDQMMVVGFNKDAEIIQDMTATLAPLQVATTKFVRKNLPNLFDALVATADALAHRQQTGVAKRAIILISDGYDSGSQQKFDQALYALQDDNIIVYALQVPDRTHGALLRDKPKPPEVLERITEGTGGKIFPVTQAAQAAKTVTDDMRNHWYRLVYTPTSVTTIRTRYILIMSHEQDVEFRTKGTQPGRYHAPE
ncbi:MAG TPA: VWA domain-containing protein [Blastocatellia bacterium]|nr:VWA domain-containing protein [Blastocatellia bacterium]